MSRMARFYFSWFFCGFDHCLRGFREGCRPYISIDSTALNGRWNGHMHSATSVDGHNWMYPVAFGFFGGKNQRKLDLVYGTATQSY